MGSHIKPLLKSKVLTVSFHYHKHSHLTYIIYMYKFKDRFLSCINILWSFQMSDAASQTMVEYALADIIYHIDNEGKLPEFWAPKKQTARENLKCLLHLTRTHSWETLGVLLMVAIVPYSAKPLCSHHRAQYSMVFT